MSGGPAEASRPRQAAGHAKTNLVLRVLARDATGYHALETVFLRLALHDTVTVAPTDGPRRLTVDWEGLPPADLGPVDQNLAWRAAERFAAAAGWPGGWAIHITKRIPAGGGMGGGSADAAAVLRALQAAAPQPLAAAALHALAAGLGADVPFALQDAPLALGRGRGDQLTPLPPLPPQPVLLVVPPFGVNTGAAYGALAAARAAAGGAPARAPLPADAMADWAAVRRWQANDFEPVVFAEHPVLADVLAQLAAGDALVARMSGSGSTLLRIGARPHPALVLPPGWRCVETETAG